MWCHFATRLLKRSRLSVSTWTQVVWEIHRKQETRGSAWVNVTSRKTEVRRPTFGWGAASAGREAACMHGGGGGGQRMHHYNTLQMWEEEERLCEFREQNGTSLKHPLRSHFPHPPISLFSLFISERAPWGLQSTKVMTEPAQSLLQTAVALIYPSCHPVPSSIIIPVCFDNTNTFNSSLNGPFIAPLRFWSLSFSDNHYNH